MLWTSLREFTALGMESYRGYVSAQMHLSFKYGGLLERRNYNNKDFSLGDPIMPFKGVQSFPSLHQSLAFSFRETKSQAVKEILQAVTESLDDGFSLVPSRKTFSQLF